KDVMIRGVGGESVVLNLAAETYFGLDELGTRIWHALHAGMTLEQACQSVAREYAVDIQTLRADVSALIEDLVRHGLLELTPA
ncbi:MAG TPA: PqqD family protein, partial [Candidatus Paceibacterota bacterium]|nr:PqqD family protein [Candidatus Paceibacterota bacterium]